MKHHALIAIAVACSLSACGKKNEAAPADTSPVATAPEAASEAAPAPAPAPAATPAAEPTAEQRELAVKQGKLDFATMEDKYINDTQAQWATSAKASSTFGDQDGKTPSEHRLAINATGMLNDKTWTNTHQDIGFDSLELGYDKPVNATEVRIVLPSRGGVEAISKVELQEADGAWRTVWSGLSDVKADQRGSRTWFVRSFEKTAAKVKGVKITFANNVQSGYKDVDAVQLVGE